MDAPGKISYKAAVVSSRQKVLQGQYADYVNAMRDDNQRIAGYPEWLTTIRQESDYDY